MKEGQKVDKSVVKQLKSKGYTYRQIAEKYGTTDKYIKKILYQERVKKKKVAEEKKARGRGRPPGSKNQRTLAEEKMLTNWENQQLAPMMREDKAELNKAASWFVTQCWKLGRTVDHENIESLENALEQYVALCVQTGMPMLVKTCHLALGLNSATVAAWRRGKTRNSDPRYKEFVEMMDAIIAAGIEAAGAAGSLDRVLTIWFEKAHFGLYEQQGLVIENNDPLGERLSAKEIVKKYEDVQLPD